MTFLLSGFGANPGSSPQPSFANVKLLVGGDGVDGSTTFTDESPSARTLTAVGNAQVDTAEKKFGTGSILLDGSGDAVSAPDSSDFELSASNSKCWEAWIRFAAGANLSAQHCIVTKYTATGNQRTWAWLYDGTLATKAMRLLISTNGSTFAFDMQRAWTPVVSTWYHVAMCRTSGNTWRMFVDGIMLGATDSFGTNDFNSTAPLRIGALESGGVIASSFNGWIDEVRYCWEAIYTSNFVPPSAAFPRS